MRRALLLLLALATLLAMLLYLFLPGDLLSFAAPPPPEFPAPHEAEPSAVQLSYVELADSPHRTEEAGATQVYGWLTRGDDGQPVNGGQIRLRFLDYSNAEQSAAETHAREASSGHLAASNFRDIRVQEDGGWYADLPGKCWIESAYYTPEPGDQAADAPRLAHRSAGIDRPLERGALEVSFRVDVTLAARGIVVDESGTPIPNAGIWPHGLGLANVRAISGEDGGFELPGLAPEDLFVEHGTIRFRVQAEGFEMVERPVPWESNQPAIPSFRVVLNHKSPVSR